MSQKQNSSKPSAEDIEKQLAALGCKNITDEMVAKGGGTTVAFFPQRLQNAIEENSKKARK